MKVRGVMKKMYSVLFLMGLILTACNFCFADSVSNRLPEAGGQTGVYLSAGYFLPYEGDLDGNYMAGLGFKYQKADETAFLDFNYSPTDLNISITGLNEVKNYLVQFGYLKDIPRHKNFRVGGAVQIHQMDFGRDIKATKTTLTGIGEYDITSRLAVRLQSSLMVKKDTVKMGSYLALSFLYSL
jgi:hypothetical protein